LIEREWVVADTTFLKGPVERYVRERLAAEYGAAFSAEVLPLVSGGTHEFDAVSADLRVVASIKSSSGKTSSGGVPTGKIKNAIAELYFLSLVRAAVRLLVLTNPDFYQILRDALKGRLAKGLGLKLIELPTEMVAKVRQVQGAASKEMSGRKSGRSRGTHRP
jgi:hypothetical protein